MSFHDENYLPINCSSVVFQQRPSHRHTYHNQHLHLLVIMFYLTDGQRYFRQKINQFVIKSHTDTHLEYTFITG